MKTKLIVTLAGLLLATICHAQTSYRNYEVFVSGAQNTNIVVNIPANTLATLINHYETNASIETFSVSIQNSNALGCILGGPSYNLSNPILGPATYSFPVYFYETNSAYVCLLFRFDTVNTTPGGGVGAAQSPGTVKAVVLQSSSNLVEWSGVTTNVSEVASNAPFKFFRVQLQ